MSKQGKEFKERVERITRLMWKKKPTTGILRYFLDLYFPDNRRRDCANFEKALIDALEGIVFKDDKQFKITNIEKHKDSECPQMVIRIEEYLPTEQEIRSNVEGIKSFLGLTPEKEFSQFCKRCPVLYYWAVEGLVPSEDQSICCQDLMRRNKEHECPQRPGKKVEDVIIGEGLDTWV